MFLDRTVFFLDHTSASFTAKEILWLEARLWSVRRISSTVIELCENAPANGAFHLTNYRSSCQNVSNPITEPVVIYEDKFNPLKLWNTGKKSRRLACEQASKGPSKLGTGQREKSAIRGSEARFKFSLCRTHDLGTCLKGYMIEKWLPRNDILKRLDRT